MNELIFPNSEYGESKPLYCIFVSEDTGQWFNTSTNTLETYTSAHWSNYAIPMVLSPDGMWYGNAPSCPAGLYIVTLYMQVGGSPASSDSEIANNEYQTIGVPVAFTSQMQLDASAFINEFAEAIVYRKKNANSVVTATLNLMAVVNRHPPTLTSEDGKTLTNDLEINIANDSTLGVTAINPGRDTITVSGRFGGLVKEHVVSIVLGSDNGIWTLRAK